jgi:CRISPR-associated endonuclease/helicase Cas3
MSTTLASSDFGAFMRAVHGVDPFPWQQRLVDEIAATGWWPEVCDLPTGAGKTATVDAAVFLQAVRHDAPRRIVFVVDRRVVVSQAAVRARRLADALRAARDPVVAAVAESLRARTRTPAGRAPDPLTVAELRGGIVRDETWAMRPDAPAVLLSTVDQVGSRLLFRGYGISRGMRPVHAGLLARDCLVLLDEVHLARPFADTVAALRRRYLGIDPDDPRWQMVELSATPGATGTRRVFRLGDDDLDPTTGGVLARRLSASKPVVLEEVVSRKDPADRRERVARTAADRARRLLRDGARTVGVIVNRVDTARQVHALLDDVPSVLVTGRMRPLERDQLLGGLGERLRTGRERRDDEALVVVSTQALEAGADIDLDALVTECASLDSLRQRFGRVDRDGWLSAAGSPPTSVVLIAKPDLDGGDPVYGDAMAETWRWLGREERDFGPLRLQLPTGGDLDVLVAPHPIAPLLLPSHLDRWCQTSTTPDADPDVAPWLHGLGREAPADVNVVWRADVTADLLSAGDAVAAALLTACRPTNSEAMPIPLAAVRRWLLEPAEGTRTEPVPVADVEAGVEVDGVGGKRTRPVLRWAGDASTVITDAGQLRPGDTIVVPATYGGVSAGSWDPTSTNPVVDLGHEAQVVARRRPVLRLLPALLPGLPDPPRPADVEAAGESHRDAVAAWLDEADAIGVDGVLGELVRRLAADTRRRVTRVATGPGEEDAMYVVTSRQPITEDVDSEPETSSFTGTAVGLLQHLGDVETWAANLAGACGLPDTVVADVALAGRLHDLGKADPRFQRMLNEGLSPSDGRLLAKSAVPAADRVARELARRASGYPRGERHELLSVALVRNATALRDQATDWDLVLHLVASHHGWARPFVPAASDDQPVDVVVEMGDLTLRSSSDHGLARVDAGIASRFWRLVRRYGWYELAWLEAILRLADHRASAAEQEVTDA